jgi:hypothetical protein
MEEFRRNNNSIQDESSELTESMIVSTNSMSSINSLNYKFYIFKNK